jgi:hypothetical protein
MFCISLTDRRRKTKPTLNSLSVELAGGCRAAAKRRGSWPERGARGVGTPMDEGRGARAANHRGSVAPIRRRTYVCALIAPLPATREVALCLG